MNELETRMQGINGLSWIGNDLHCDSTRSLRAALRHLRGLNYDVKDLRKEGYSIREGRVTPKQMEQNGWSVYYASLDVRHGKCGSCNSYIAVRGIRMHGRTCEQCGAVVYREITDGTQVSFTFVNDDQGWLKNKLRMEAKRWDADENWLYLKMPPVERGSQGWFMDATEAAEYLRTHSDKWEPVTEDGEHLMRVYYPRPRLSLNHHKDARQAIDMRDIYGHEHNSTIVLLWEGKEYPEHHYGSDSRLPVHESVNVYADYLRK